MRKRQKVAWSAAVLLLLFLAAIGLSNLRRLDPGPRAFPISSSQGNAPAEAMVYRAQKNAGPAPQALSFESASAVSDRSPERKLIRNAGLELTVADVRAAVEQVRKVTEASGGDISNLEITGGRESVSASLVVRVPASGLVSAVSEYKKLAVRTDHEEMTGRDVTREFYDNQAHLNNLRAEEQQYLTIMKQARTVSDILEVSEKVSDVRDRIERLQAQIQVMTHDIEMSAVSITLTQVSAPQVLGVQWRPLYNAKIAARELMAGLGDWIDWVVALLIKLPLIVLWMATVGALLWLVWKIVRAVWLRFLKPNHVRKVEQSSAVPPASQTGVEPIP